MEIQIAQQINPVFECLSILVRQQASNRSYATLKKEIKARLDIELPEVEKLLDSLQDISDKVTKVVNQNDEITAYLFHPLGSQDSTPAEAILQFYGDFSEQDPLRIQAGVLTAFHCNPLNFLYTTLDNYNLLYTGSGENH